jgi:hypothetical protein
MPVAPPWTLARHADGVESVPLCVALYRNVRLLGGRRGPGEDGFEGDGVLGFPEAEGE